MLLGSSDFTGNFILIDGATAPLVSIGAGADLAAISLDKAGDQVEQLNRSVLTLSNALPIATANLSMFAGAAAFAKREVSSLNAELAKTIGLMAGLSVVSSAHVPLVGGGRGSSTSIISVGGSRKQIPVWTKDVAPGNLLPRGPMAAWVGTDKTIGVPRFTRTGAIGYKMPHPIIRSLSTKKIGALIYQPEIETQRSIARLMGEGASLAEAEKVIRLRLTDRWGEINRANEMLSRPIRVAVPVKSVSKKEIVSHPSLPYYVKEAIENAEFREIIPKEKVPDANEIIRDLQAHFRTVGTGSITASDEDIIKRRYATDSTLMRRISSTVNEYMGKKGAYSTYNPYLNQRLFKAFTEGEEGLKLSKMEKSILTTLREDKKLLKQFTGPTQGISWRIGKDRGFQIKDLAIMSQIKTSEMAKMSEMLTPEQFDDWVANQYFLRNPLGLKKTQAMETIWRTGEREMIYPIRDWQRELIKSLSKSQLTEITHIKKGTWTQEALAKESLRRIRRGVPLHFDELFDKHPELLPKTELLPGRIAPFVPAEGDAGLRRVWRSTPYQTALKDIAAKQRLQKTVSQFYVRQMDDAVKSLAADFDRYGVDYSKVQFWDAQNMPLFDKQFAGRSLQKVPEPILRKNQKRFNEWFNARRAIDWYGPVPTDADIKKRHDRSFMREKIQKNLVRTQYWESLQYPFFATKDEDARWVKQYFEGRPLDKTTGPLPIRANQKRYMDWMTEQRAWQTHLGSLRAGRGLPKDYHLKEFTRKKALLEPLRAWEEYNNEMTRLREGMRILPAPVDPFTKFKPRMAQITKRLTPTSIRTDLFENVFADLGLSSREASVAAKQVESSFKGMGNKAVSAKKATRTFADALRKMGASSTVVAAGSQLLGSNMNRLNPALHRAAFGSSLLNSRLGRLAASFTTTGHSARKFGMLSAIAFNEPLMFMGAMLGLMPPLIGGFAALGAAVLGLVGAFALLGLGGAMAWGDKLKGNADRLKELNAELSKSGPNISTDGITKSSYSVQGLTTDIGGLSLVLEEFKKETGPVFKEFGKLWIPYMETLPDATGRAFRKIFSVIAPYSSLIQRDAKTIGSWSVNLVSGALKYSLELLRDPEIRSSFRTLMDAIPKYGRRGMDFIVNAFLENKETIQAFLKSVIELLPPFLSATTSFFRTIVPVISAIIKLVKGIAWIFGAGDANRGAGFFGFVVGAIAAAGLITKITGLVGKLVDKFGALKDILQATRIEQTGLSAIERVGGGVLSTVSKSAPKTTPPIIVPGGGKVPKPTGKLPTILAGGGQILVKALPAAAFIAIAAGLGYVAYDAYEKKQASIKLYKTDPQYAKAVDSAEWTEHLAKSKLKLNPVQNRVPDMSNLTNAYNQLNKPIAENNLQTAPRGTEINVNITADPGFVAKVNSAMKKDTEITTWVHYRS